MRRLEAYNSFLLPRILLNFCIIISQVITSQTWSLLLGNFKENFKENCSTFFKNDAREKYQVYPMYELEVSDFRGKKTVGQTNNPNT